MAIKVQKSMLKKSGYRWKAAEGDNARLVKHDAIMFSRHEGYEVIRMVQKMVDHFGYETEDDVRRVENAIGNELPGNVRSQKNVQAWLKEHLSTH